VTYKSTALFVKIVAQPTISHMKPQPHTVLWSYVLGVDAYDRDAKLNWFIKKIMSIKIILN
jgi:hypothetical protein